jgi:hypothetical protein
MRKAVHNSKDCVQRILLRALPVYLTNITIIFFALPSVNHPLLLIVNIVPAVRNALLFSYSRARPSIISHYRRRRLGLFATLSKSFGDIVSERLIISDYSCQYNIDI